MACKDFARSVEHSWCPSKYLSVLMFCGFNKKISENNKKTKKMKSLEISKIPRRGSAVDGRVLAMDRRGLACKEYVFCV